MFANAVLLYAVFDIASLGVPLKHLMNRNDGLFIQYIVSVYIRSIYV